MDYLIRMVMFSDMHRETIQKNPEISGENEMPAAKKQSIES